MAQQNINIGTQDAKTGDSLFTAFTKTEANFTELFSSGNNAVYISQESDFPTQDATTITLDINTPYILTGTFSTAKNILPKTGASLECNSGASFRLTFTGAGAMFSGVDQSFYIHDIQLDAGTGNTLFDMTDSGGGTTLFVAERLLIITALVIGSFTGLSLMSIRSCVSIVTISKGIVINGANNALVSITDFRISSPSGAFIGLDLNTSISQTWEIDDLSVVAPAGAVGISGAAASANVPAGGLGMVTRCEFIGAMTDLAGITVDDIRWSFRDNTPTRDTFADGLASLNDNTTATVISSSSSDGSNSVVVAGTWVCERQSLFSCTTAGRFTWLGERNIIIPIDVIGTLNPASDNTLAVYVAINGTAIPASGIPSYIKSADPRTMATMWQIELQQNDYIEVCVENQTGTDNITVTDMIFRVR